MKRDGNVTVPTNSGGGLPARRRPDRDLPPDPAMATELIPALAPLASV